MPELTAWSIPFREGNVAIDVDCKADGSHRNRIILHPVPLHKLVNGIRLGIKHLFDVLLAEQVLLHLVQDIPADLVVSFADIIPTGQFQGIRVLDEELHQVRTVLFKILGIGGFVLICSGSVTGKVPIGIPGLARCQILVNLGIQEAMDVFDHIVFLAWSPFLAEVGRYLCHCGLNAVFYSIRSIILRSFHIGFHFVSYP